MACEAFTYNSVSYPKGTCTYVDAASTFGWCGTSTATPNGPFTGGAGASGSNWDVCTCGTSKIS